MCLRVYFLLIFFILLIDFTLFYLFYTPCFYRMVLAQIQWLWGQWYQFLRIWNNRYVTINYRAIVLSNILIKILDWVILIKEESALCSSHLQFGFKKGMSTTQCTSSMLETVNYYNFNKSNVFVLMLDASKAFDWVNYCKLFRELLNCIEIIIIHVYQSDVKWGHTVSICFIVRNGVKQGGVLSPLLFAIYTDSLLKRLEESGVGCHMGGHFTGALAYADDITLLS